MVALSLGFRGGRRLRAAGRRVSPDAAGERRRRTRAPRAGRGLKNRRPQQSKRTDGNNQHPSQTRSDHLNLPFCPRARVSRALEAIGAYGGEPNVGSAPRLKSAGSDRQPNVSTSTYGIMTSKRQTRHSPTKASATDASPRCVASRAAAAGRHPRWSMVRGSANGRPAIASSAGRSGNIILYTAKGAIPRLREWCC